MLDKNHRAGLFMAAGALTLAGCNFDWIVHILKKGGHHKPPPTGGEECPVKTFPSSEDPDVCVRQATSISAGVGYSCATLMGGGLKCWGGDSWYRLGYGGPQTNRGDEPGELGDALPNIPFGDGVTAAQVYADSDVTCAILASGNVKCWGYNGYGVVTGMPFPASIPDTVDTLPERSFSEGRTAVQVAAGSGSAYALLDDGNVVRWGPNVSEVGFGEGRVAVQFGRSTLYDNWHICVVLDDGNVACGVTGFAGQLGFDPSAYPNPMPPEGYPLVDLGTGRTASEVALGDAHTCALLDGGDVKCWGFNAYGQLGLGDTDNRGLLPAGMGDALPVVPLGAPAVAITAGRNHSCALLDSGVVKCWGRNDTGQLGIGSVEDIGDAPGEVAALTGVDLGTGRTAVAIDAGGHTCALLDNGAVKCWGENSLGQLGQGDTDARGDAPGELGDALAEIDLGS